jgi:hypothetical protein
MVGAIKRIGIVLLDFVLYPVQQTLNLLSKIPGMGKWAAEEAQKVKALRQKLGLADPEANTQPTANKDKKLNTEAAIQKEIQRLMDKRANMDIASESFNKITKKIDALREKLNKASGSEIDSPFVPSTTNSGKGKGTKSVIGTKTNDAIATGGVKPTTINLSIKNMVENFKVEANGITESAEKTTESLVDALNRALGIALTTAQ